MNETEIYEKVVGLIKPYAKNQAALANIKGETKILEDLDVNSARLVDLVLSFEDEFDIEVEDEEADEIWTLSDAVNIISSKLQ